MNFYVVNRKSGYKKYYVKLLNAQFQKKVKLCDK